MKFLPILPLFILLLSACHEPVSKQSKSLSDYFKEMPAADTMRFELPENEELTAGDTIPNGLFFSQLETHLMNDVNYLDDSDELKVIGRFRFPLTENVEAWLVEMHQHWFKNQSLFLFDKTKKAFTERQTVAEFYGGDGGQILTGSWLLDVDGDGRKDLVRREIEHWLLLDGEEPRDTTTARAALLLWKNERFEPVQVQDSAALIRRFPIHSFW